MKLLHKYRSFEITVDKNYIQENTDGSDSNRMGARENDEGQFTAIYNGC